MEALFSLAASRASVGGGELRQAEARSFGNGTVFVLASALGPPRLWGYALDAALEGFQSGLGAAPDGRLITSLHQGFEAARQLLQKRVEALVERIRCDAGLLALTFESGSVQVLCVGPVRAYLRRQGQVRRLSQCEDRSEGLMAKLRPSPNSERVEPNDLVVAGSLGAFCDESLQRIGAALAHDEQLEPAAVTELLNRSAAQSRQGVCSLAVRVPKF